MTPEARSAARNVLPLASALREGLATFRAEHPTIADYRIEESYEAAARVERLLTYLDTGQDPELDAALTRFRAAFFA